jgi:hypothetical protein
MPRKPKPAKKPARRVKAKDDPFVLEIVCAKEGRLFEHTICSALEAEGEFRRMAAAWRTISGGDVKIHETGIINMFTTRRLSELEGSGAERIGL